MTDQASLPNHEPPPQNIVPHGLFFGGVYLGAEAITYLAPDGSPRTANIGKINIEMGSIEDRCETFYIPDDVILDVPLNTPVLLNVKGRSKDRQMKWQYCDNHGHLASDEAQTSDGQFMPLTGLFIIGRFNGPIERKQRDWNSAAPNATLIKRWIKFATHCGPADIDHPEVEVVAPTPVPKLIKGVNYIVPVSAYPTKDGIAYRLTTDFKVMKWDGDTRAT